MPQSVLTILIGAILGGAVAAPQGKEGSDATIDIDWDSGEEAMADGRIATKVMGKDAGGAVAGSIDGLGDEATSMIGGVIVLKEIGDVMVKNPAWTLQVEGHTDNIGRATANQDLSTRRLL